MTKYRQSRKGEVVCYADCYSFPHRQFGASCTLLKWVARFWERHFSGSCRDCMNFSEGQCQVVEGSEEPWHCPELRDHIRYEEIKLYGRAAEQRDRSERRTKQRSPVR